MNPRLRLDYFNALEDDLARLSRFIEFSPDNYQTHSLELVRLLLASGSEVEVALKELCKTIKPSAKPNKIFQYQPIVFSFVPEIAQQAVRIPRADIALTPWKNWAPKNSPKWWQDYNAVKHDRLAEYKKGNLENVLNAAAGLGVIMQYVAGPHALTGGNYENFRGTLGGIFTDLHLCLRKT